MFPVFDATSRIFRVCYVRLLGLHFIFYFICVTILILDMLNALLLFYSDSALVLNFMLQTVYFTVFTSLAIY